MLISLLENYRMAGLFMSGPCLFVHIRPLFHIRFGRLIQAKFAALEQVLFSTPTVVGNESVWRLGISSAK